MKYSDRITPSFDNRSAPGAVEPMFTQRWSPRAFKKASIADADIDTLFEAARWAPSCFNEQPWTFYVSSDDSFEDFLKLLVPANQTWAKNASLLCFAVCDTRFKANGKENNYARFDTGAAWMSLALQARALGLYTHGMGGVLHDEAVRFLGLAEDQQVICGIAIGVADEAATLPDALRDKETPSARKPLREVYIRR